MAHAASVSQVDSAGTVGKAAPRHPSLVRVTHWITALSFLALVLTGIELVISHPRFYWGDSGNVNTPALFQLPIPASRAAVQTGYDYVLPDQNGWSRDLHFQAAWVVVFTGAVYVLYGCWAGHFQRRLLAPSAGPGSYNTVQRLTYLGVIFLLFPFMIWTGLAMSPAFTAAFPWTVNLLGGHQSARTLHFGAFAALCGFFVIHIVMVWRAGFLTLVREMVTGKRGGGERL